MLLKDFCCLLYVHCIGTCDVAGNGFIFIKIREGECRVPRSHLVKRSRDKNAHNFLSGDFKNVKALQHEYARSANKNGFIKYKSYRFTYRKSIPWKESFIGIFGWQNLSELQKCRIKLKSPDWTIF